MVGRSEDSQTIQSSIPCMENERLVGSESDIRLAFESINLLVTTALP